MTKTIARKTLGWLILVTAVVYAIIGPPLIAYDGDWQRVWRFFTDAAPALAKFVAFMAVYFLLGIVGRRLIAILVVVILPLSAATIIQPPPAGEGDTLAIVADFCPECVRLSDDQDLYFREPGERYYVYAFEDLVDFDFNDLVVWAVVTDGNLGDWGLIASYTAAHPSFEWLFGTAVNNSSGAGTGPVTSVSWANLDGLDHLATWTLPAGVTAVPEPQPWLAVLSGLAAAWWTRKGWRR